MSATTTDHMCSTIALQGNWVKDQISCMNQLLLWKESVYTLLRVSNFHETLEKLRGHWPTKSLTCFEASKSEIFLSEFRNLQLVVINNFELEHYGTDQLWRGSSQCLCLDSLLVCSSSGWWKSSEVLTTTNYCPTSRDRITWPPLDKAAPHGLVDSCLRWARDPCFSFIYFNNCIRVARANFIHKSSVMLRAWRKQNAPSVREG